MSRTDHFYYIRRGPAGACEVGYREPDGTEHFKIIPDASPLNPTDHLRVHAENRLVQYFVNDVCIETLTLQEPASEPVDTDGRRGR